MCYVSFSVVAVSSKFAAIFGSCLGRSKAKGWCYREQPCSLWGCRCLVGAQVCVRSAFCVRVCMCARRPADSGTSAECLPFPQSFDVTRSRCDNEPCAPPQGEHPAVRPGLCQSSGPTPTTPPTHTHTLCKHSSGGADLHSALINFHTVFGWCERDDYPTCGTEMYAYTYLHGKYQITACHCGSNVVVNIRARQIHRLADIICRYWPITDISVSAYVLSDMCQCT